MNLIESNAGTSTTVNADLSASAAVQPRTTVLFSADNHPEDNASPLIYVDALAQVITAFGLSGTRQCVVYAVYRSTDGDLVETPLIINGTPLVLTATCNRVWLITEGVYRIRTVNVPRYSLTLLCTPTTRPPPAVSSTASNDATQPTTNPARVLHARLSDAFTYVNANTIVPFPDEVHNLLGDTATFDAEHKVFTPVTGVWHVSAQCRVIGLSGGTYFELSLMSGSNTIAADRFTWTAENPCTAISMLVDTIVSAAQTTNKALHVQFSTDADTSTAFFYPNGSKVIARRLGDS